jgi:hypothetical protein
MLYLACSAVALEKLQEFVGVEALRASSVPGSVGEIVEVLSHYRGEWARSNALCRFDITS